MIPRTISTRDLRAGHVILEPDFRGKLNPVASVRKILPYVRGERACSNVHVETTGDQTWCYPASGVVTVQADA
jgi:hypothetical protein